VDLYEELLKLIRMFLESLNEGQCQSGQMDSSAKRNQLRRLRLDVTIKECRAARGL
jgi:hypothetical protein